MNNNQALVVAKA